MPRERLSAFVDAVIAIVMTILVLELKKPSEVTWEALWELRSHFFAYAVSFLWLGAMWINEAYSWGVGEYDSEDGVDGGSEGCVGAAVVGVKDAPGFQLRDTSFYEVADSVDFLVELLFTVV